MDSSRDTARSASSLVEPPRSLGQRTGQDRAEPGLELDIASAAELAKLLVRDQERFLGHIRRVNLTAQLRIDLEPSQEPQIIRVLLQ